MQRPLVELHVHLEGSVPPELLVTLADRHGRPEVPGLCLTDDAAAYRPVSGFMDFLERFKAVSAVVATPADHRDVALAMAARMAAEGVVYAEVTVAYGVLRKRDRDPLPIQRALAEAAHEARELHGVHLRWLPDAVRQWGPDAAWHALENAVKAGPELGVVGFGLGGDETALPAADFADHFRDARREGLGTTCHAGETGGPENVRSVVMDCGVDRVGHAVSAARDPQTLALLASRGVHVELCPGSNVATGAVPDRDAHPLRVFLDAGVPCSLHTDDPALFDTTLRSEYAEAAARHALTDAEATAMVRSALDASFAPDPLKQEIGALLAEDADR